MGDFVAHAGWRQSTTSSFEYTYRIIPDLGEAGFDEAMRHFASERWRVMNVQMVMTNTKDNADVQGSFLVYLYRGRLGEEPKNDDTQ